MVFGFYGCGRCWLGFWNGWFCPVVLSGLFLYGEFLGYCEVLDHVLANHVV